MPGTLHRWRIILDEVGGNILPLLAKQDRVMLVINARIISTDWFQKNVDFYYLRRNNKDGVGLWFQYIQTHTDSEDIEDWVSQVLGEICSFQSNIEHQPVFEAAGTCYSTDLKEEWEFQDFLMKTTHIALNLLSENPWNARRVLLAARIRAMNSTMVLWDTFEPIIFAARTYQQMENEQKDAYRISFAKIVKGQHWAHFLCNMVLLADPHPDYNQKRIIPEHQWRQILGL